MSVKRFAAVLNSAELSANDRTWFARWIDWYARFCQVDEQDPIPVDRERVIRFLQEQKRRERKAWQRFQVVGAIELYQNAVTIDRTRSPKFIERAVARQICPYTYIAGNFAFASVQVS